MEGRGGEVLAVAVLFFILTWLTLGLRVYVRGYMLKNWGKDDTAILVTVVSPQYGSTKPNNADSRSFSSLSTSPFRLSPPRMELGGIGGNFQTMMRRQLSW
jgi:hypothetical protein